MKRLPLLYSESASLAIYRPAARNELRPAMPVFQHVLSYDNDMLLQFYMLHSHLKTILYHLVIMQSLIHVSMETANYNNVNKHN